MTIMRKGRGRALQSSATLLTFANDPPKVGYCLTFKAIIPMKILETLKDALNSLQATALIVLLSLELSAYIVCKDAGIGLALILAAFCAGGWILMILCREGKITHYLHPRRYGWIKATAAVFLLLTAVTHFLYADVEAQRLLTIGWWIAIAGIVLYLSLALLPAERLIVPPTIKEIPLSAESQAEEARTSEAEADEPNGEVEAPKAASVEDSATQEPKPQRLPKKAAWLACWRTMPMYIFSGAVCTLFQTTFNGIPLIDAITFGLIFVLISGLFDLTLFRRAGR